MMIPTRIPCPCGEMILDPWNGATPPFNEPVACPTCGQEHPCVGSYRERADLDLPLAPVDWLLKAMQNNFDVLSASIASGGHVVVLLTDGRRCIIGITDITAHTGDLR